MRTLGGVDAGAGSENQSTREAWLEETLAAIKPGSRILDAGAGERQYERFCGHLDYVSQDFAQYDGKGDGIALQMGTWDQSSLDIVSDISAIPEADESFDAIMCIEVLEHLPAPVDALRELSRLLKPGGILLVTAPFCSLTHFAPYFYHTGYGRYFYEYWFPRLRLMIDDITPNGNYFEWLGQEVRRLPDLSKRNLGHRGLAWWKRLAMGWMLRWLQELSDTDYGSAELLHFGYHVRARKALD